MTAFERWKEGNTGCPIVDASMKCLNKTGYLSNRCRMTVSNYLIKDLHINWTLGEKYFATKLSDYDPSLNNGGWQWSAHCGTDYVPGYRIFNPWVQSRKFDTYADFIKKWIPSLEDVKADDIHSWEESWQKYPDVDYPQPMVIHEEEK